MKTVRVNLDPLKRNVQHTVRPNFSDNFSEENSVSKWRYLDEELGYYLESVKYIEGPNCYDEILLK